MLPHAAHLPVAGSSYAWSFGPRLAPSPLQRKPDEWRRQYATPPSGGRAYTVTLSPNKKKNIELKATFPSVFSVVPTNDNEHSDVDSKGDDAGTRVARDVSEARLSGD